jgi:hypothetical protein
MIVVVIFYQDTLARDQYTNTFTLKDMVHSAITLPTPNITHVRISRCVGWQSGCEFHDAHNGFLRDSTPHQSVPTALVGLWACFGLLLVVTALAFWLWRVRQGTVHTERISLAHLVPRMSVSASFPDER